MTMPTWQDILLPFLQSIEKGDSRRLLIITEDMIEHFDLTDEERKERQKNNQRKIHNNVSWASTHLFKAGLIRRPSKGNVQITDEGHRFLITRPNSVSIKTLAKFPSYAQWQTNLKRKRGSVEPANKQGNETLEQKLNPADAIDVNLKLLQEQLVDDLLTNILDKPSDFLERIVCEIMEAMGYGQAEVTGRSGDGGIDGIVKQDQIGFERIYLQAKRYKDQPVRSPEVREFIGSLPPGGKGVLFTTSEFTKDAFEAINSAHDKSLVLIEGKELANLMVDNNVGVSVQSSIDLKIVDSDYFNPEG
ncbi:MAG: restriction endonuclease [Anaerolineaceae bacterium]|nr:restriction endonuclease [Anaerolineaceae bacterium]MDE0328305.1 restriction endonuclease [Anaerolineaceae bacterium]